jgi:hypothetical protein
VVGALLFVVAAASAGRLVRAALFAAGRGRGGALALLAPLAVIAALLGLVLMFVPGFFG